MLEARLVSRRSLIGWLGLAPLSSVWGCGPRHLDRPPQGPRLSSASQTIPPDLHVNVRVALARLRDELGPEALTRIQRGGELSTLSDPTLARALALTETAWVALRLGLPAEHTDNVVALEGNFADFSPAADVWESPSDLGGPWQRWDRRDKPARALPARIYRKADDTLVFVSEAEVDAVARLVERGVRVEMIEPPALGVLSIAASMPALAHVLRPSAPRAAELLSKGTALTGHASFDPSGEVRVDLDFEFKTHRQAERSAAAAQLLLAALAGSGGPVGQIARGAHVEAVGRAVALRLAVAGAAFLEGVQCKDGSAGCS